MTVFNKSEIINMLLANNQSQPKAKYSNNVLLEMLKAVSDSTMFSVEPTRSGFPINRGTLCEEIVKAVLGVKVDKTQKSKADIDLQGVDKARFEIPSRARKIEVKFATSFAPATASQPTTKYTILVCPFGAYLIDSANHQERFTTSTAWKGIRLEKLSEILGLH